MGGDGARLFTIASPGGSGTRWYAQLFTTGRSHCFHELSSLLRRYPSNVAALHELHTALDDYDGEQSGRRLVLECFPEYFARHWEQAEGGATAVGNSDGIVLPMLSALWLLWPPMRFLFSFRDGINQVNSMLVWESNMEPAMLAIWQTRHGSSDYFELCCRSWVSEVSALELHRDRLRAVGADVDETRFEHMVGDLEELRRVWTRLVGGWEEFAERNRAFTARRVNARAGRERALGPDEVWESWSPERRATFAAVCGATQLRLGYALPTAWSGA